MILCDTNIFIEIYRDNKKIIESVKQIGQQNLAISDVSRAEPFFGVRNKKELQAIHKDMDNLLVLPIDIIISEMAVNLVEHFSLSHKLSLPDALIAATCIQYKIELYTLNIKDFKFLEGIKLFSL